MWRRDVLTLLPLWSSLAFLDAELLCILSTKKPDSCIVVIEGDVQHAAQFILVQKCMPIMSCGFADEAASQIVATASLTIEHKFIHGCSKVKSWCPSHRWAVTLTSYHAAGWSHRGCSCQRSSQGSEAWSEVSHVLNMACMWLSQTLSLMSVQGHSASAEPQSTAGMLQGHPGLRRSQCALL